MTMPAMVVERFGQQPRSIPWIISDPANDEIFVDVRACGLNFADLLMIEGTYQDTPDVPFVPGMEICGIVRKVGVNVEGLKPGQRIAAFSGHGGLAGHATVRADRAVVVPDGMSDEVAAGFLVAYGTSHLALVHRARLESGETLVVLGAAGGVGLTAVETGKALGARVIAVARGDDRLAVARKAGADHVIDSEAGDLHGVLKALGPTNVVYDPIGGALGEAALRALAPEGRHLLIGFASGDLPQLKPNHLMVKNTSVLGLNWSGYLKFRPDVLRGSLAELMAWHEAGRIKPHVSHVLPYEQALDGLELLRNRRATGKVVIRL